MTTKEFQAKVNPVYTTGKGTAVMLAASGNKEAGMIVSKMDLSELARGNSNAVPPEIKKCYIVSLEARYEISNEMIRRVNKPNIIDLPSGYTPRAFLEAEEGRHYYGLDLPVVADDIGVITDGFLPENLKDKVEYHGVDATNYDSLQNALANVNGEVCIIMDGLLGYFNEPELLSICENIKRILKKHGGCWLTADATSEKIFGATFGTLLKDNPEILNTHAMSTANQMGDVDMKKNSLYTGGIEGAVQFLDSQGFTLKKTSFADLMPSLRSLADAPGIEKELREAYRGIEIWEMTLKENAEVTTNAGKPDTFSADLSVTGDTLKISLGGRLDSITAADLLEKYETISSGESYTNVEIDVKNLVYISSAGLRVLLMIFKKLESKEQFKITNIAPTVMEIFEITGFDSILL